MRQKLRHNSAVTSFFNFVGYFGENLSNSISSPNFIILNRVKEQFRLTTKRDHGSLWKLSGPEIIWNPLDEFII